MGKDVRRSILVAAAAVVMIVVNILANALPFNDLTTGEISDRFQVYFVPEGYVFSIWGLIYIGIIAYVIYQALPAQRPNADLRKIGYLFVIGSLANAAWIFLWHYEYFALTLLAMLILLVSLIAIYLRLRIGLIKVPAAMRWCVHLPFSIYLGWITVATIANVTSLLYYYNWGGWGLAPEVWAVIMLLVGAVVASLVGLRRHDLAYVLVILWAYVGIIVKHADVLPVVIAAAVAIAIVAAAGVIGYLRGRPAAGRLAA